MQRALAAQAVAVRARDQQALHLSRLWTSTSTGTSVANLTREGGAMAHPDEELVRRGYEAFNNADVETLRQLFAATTIFHEPGRSPISGDYEGLDQVLGFFGTLAERSGGTFRATLHDVLANDEHVVGLHSSDAERDGRSVRSPTVLVFHVRDGRIAETWSHHYDQHEFDEFWV
jgi:ketosteroid isomerase-like protein